MTYIKSSSMVIKRHAFQEVCLCPSCFLLERGNLIAPFISQTAKRVCLQQQCAIVVSRIPPSLSPQLKQRWYLLEEAG